MQSIQAVETDDIEDVVDDIDYEDMQRKRDELLQGLGGRLSRLADEQVALRQTTEERWLRDLQQYHGLYSEDVRTALKESGLSDVYINKTRSKTNTAEARLAEMLLPTDDKNWGLGPTPVPELSKASTDATPLIAEDGGPVVEPDGQPATVADAVNADLELAREKAARMEREIDDQLNEADYNQSCRMIIHDACLYGTGIIKGPVVVSRERKEWEQITDGEESIHVLKRVPELKPGAMRVDPWDYYPDMSARRHDEIEFEFERKYLTAKMLRNMAKQPGYIVDQIRTILEEGPKSSTSSTATHLSRMREAMGLQTQIDENRFEIWEYHGPIAAEDLMACGCEVEDDDPLNEMSGTIEFCGTTVIKAHINPLETEESIYSVFNYEPDETSLLGYGVPHIMRSQQDVLNAAWRMMMDNSAISTAPMYLFDQESVEPIDGKWEIRQRKGWRKKDSTVTTQQAISTFEFPNHQGELQAIIQMASQIIDEETSLPMLAQGEVGNSPDTASGMSMLLNSSNTVLRRIVKSFDDNITRKIIGRFYDWNMQENEDESLKGDYNVDARGSSALLVKETQQQALMQLMNFAAHPVFGPMIKPRELFAKAVEAQHISPDEVIKSQEEIDADAQKNQGQQSDPRMALEQFKAQNDKEKFRAQTKIEEQRFAAEMQAADKLAQIKAQDAEADRQVKLALAQMERDGDMMELAARKDITLEQIKAKLGDTAIRERSKQDLFAAEAELKRTEGSGI